MNINFITSYLFLITAFYSWYRNVISICIGCILCFITSIIYHACLEYNISAPATTTTTTTAPATTTTTTTAPATTAPATTAPATTNTTTTAPATTYGTNEPIHHNVMWYIRMIDVIVCNASVIIFSISSIGFNIWYLFGLLCAYYNYFIYYKCQLSTCPTYGEYWHSTIHVVGNIGIICMVESCVCS